MPHRLKKASENIIKDMVKIRYCKHNCDILVLLNIFIDKYLLCNVLIDLT